jgi:hypothetical protein
MNKVENQIRSGQRRREDSVLREIFQAHALDESIPPHKIESALRSAGVDISIAEELVRCYPCGVEYEDFKHAVLSPSPLEMWAGSIPLSNILADALPKSSNGDPLRRISVLSDEEIACVAEGVGAALKEVLTRKVESLHQAYLKLDEQIDSQIRASKFQVYVPKTVKTPKSLPFVCVPPSLPSSCSSFLHFPSMVFLILSPLSLI